MFLDEIGDASPALQASLLRVLQESEVLRVGDTKPVPTDVRIIAATNRDLEKEIEAGSFREDLYYRLAIVLIELPPLRARLSDIPALATYIAAKHSEREKKAIRRIVASHDRIALLLLQGRGRWTIQRGYGAWSLVGPFGGNGKYVLRFSPNSQVTPDNPSGSASTTK